MTILPKTPGPTGDPYDESRWPVNAEPRRALNAALATLSTDADPKERLMEYARGQRAKGEAAVAASSTLKSMRQIKRDLVAGTQHLTNAIAALANEADLTDAAKQRRREALGESLVIAVNGIVDKYVGLERTLLSDFPDVQPPELRDLTVTPEQASRLAVYMAQAPLMQPADFVALCWSAVTAFDTVSAVALLPVINAFKDDPRYDAVAAQTPIGAPAPLDELAAGIALLRISWKQHAARIAREVLMRFHGQMETVALTLAAEYQWVGSLPARITRPDGALSSTPDLDPLDGEPTNPNPQPFDDPAYRTAGQRAPYPILYA